MQVAEVMTRASVTESPSEALASAAARMWGQQTGSLLVVDGPALLGILTERDVLGAVARGFDLATTPVRAVMSAPVLTVLPSLAVDEAARLMSERWVRHLPVVEDGAVLGVVSQRDLLGALVGAGGDGAAEALVRERRLARLAAGTGGAAGAEDSADTDTGSVGGVGG